MDYPPWQSSRERLGTYSPRNPWESPLYQLVYQYRDEFEQRWDELFFEQYGHLREEVLDAFDRFLNCGVLKHGCARAHCTKCNHSILIAFSCKRRAICPSCQAKRAIIFAEHLHEHILLPYPHRHLTFTIPKRLRIYFRYDRSLLSELYQAAWHALTDVIAQYLPGATPGAVMALHTWGNTLNWHPHVHAIVLAGALTEEAKFLPLEHFDTELITEQFAQNCFAFLLKRKLIEPQTVDLMRSWQHSGFNVHAAEPIDAKNEDARLFIARYLKKAPLALTRLSHHFQLRQHVVEYRSGQMGEEITKTFSPLEFLALLSLHIPKVYEQTTRHLGVYSSRYRGAQRRKKQFQLYLESNKVLPLYEPPPRKPTAYWAASIKLVYEVDPLECTRCGAQMKIVAFIQNPKEIQKIADNLGLPTWRAPPLANSQQDVFIDSSPEFNQTLH